MINPFRIKRNYNTMIEEEKKLFPNADVYGPNNITKKKMKQNILKPKITQVENLVNLIDDLNL